MLFPLVNRRRHQTTRRATNHTRWWVSLLAPLVVVLTGCADPILSDKEPRSQYDRYDAVRDQYAPQWVTNEYGEKRVNLRGRLLPRD